MYRKFYDEVMVCGTTAIRALIGLAGNGSNIQESHNVGVDKESVSIMTGSSNQHVFDYLSYYVSLQYPPQYAVLVSGPWGVGKTFLVKKFLRENFTNSERKVVHVSLYGLSTIEEINDALFREAFPLLGGKGAKIAGRLLTTGLKYFGYDPGELSIKDAITTFNADVYVFDDLERYEGQINKALGYINQFVEHDDAKVIIIANEKEINSDGEYRRRREKLIGKTIEVQSSFTEAFAEFVAKIDDQTTKSFLETHVDEISSLYECSNKNNLRILQQTMWDFERFCKALTDEHRANTEAIVALLKLFFALSLEIKAGDLVEEDFETGRGMSAMIQASLNKDSQPSRMAVAAQRYPATDLHDSILSNSVLINCLVKGIVDPVEIQASLNESRFFVNVPDEAPWRTVWHWTERTEPEVMCAVDKMSKQFEDRVFTIGGEILHVFGLQLFLADIGVIKSSRRDIVDDGKRYIDDLYRTKKLKITENEDAPFRFNSYGQLGIQSAETPEYRELFDYLREINEKAVRENYPDKAARLIELMSTDIQMFYRRLCVTNSVDSIYYDTPLLASLDSKNFVTSVLALPPVEQHVVFMMFKARYDHDRLSSELADEKSWAEAMKAEFLQAAESGGPITAKRLRYHIDHYMKAIP